MSTFFNAWWIINFFYFLQYDSRIEGLKFYWTLDNLYILSVYYV